MSTHTSWTDVRAQAPELAALVQAIFTSGTNKTLATLRADGSPRISGTELEFAGDDVTLGMMPGSRKLQDVLRDPRVAIHSPTLEPPSDVTQWIGDAKLAGRLVEIPGPGAGPPGAYFALDVAEVVHTCVDPTGKLLVVTSWQRGRGLTTVRRE